MGIVLPGCGGGICTGSGFGNGICNDPGFGNGICNRNGGRIFTDAPIYRGEWYVTQNGVDCSCCGI